MIAVGSDHGGYQLKKAIVDYLSREQVAYKDVGTFGPESVDYPDFAQKVAEEIKSGSCDRGIVVCGTGIGISIAVNKFSGIRAALCTNEYMAKMSREHNDANVLALGERVIGEGTALQIVQTWLQTEFEGGRHTERIQKIGQIEQNTFDRSEEGNE